MLREWDDLPEYMKHDKIKEYYDILAKHKFSLEIKRVFDLILAVILLDICAIPMLVIAVLIVADSKGGVFYTQERITVYGKKFKIHKFRTMVENADKIGTSVTVSRDNRITRVGGFLRKYRLDELPQLFDIIAGNMSFVGTRPEVVKYVKKYTPEMRATLLLPAGITSEASIRYKDEADMLENADDVDEVYIRQVLPEKMKYNLQAVRDFSVMRDVVTMFRTIFVVFGKSNNK